MNKKQIKIEMLLACKEILKPIHKKALNKSHLIPFGEFVDIIDGAITKSLDFYDIQLEKPNDIENVKCESIKVSLLQDHINVKYLINFVDLFEIMGAGPFEMLMGSVDFNVFFNLLNEFSSEAFNTSFIIDEMEGTIVCETKFNVDSLLDYAKRMPKTQKLF